MNSDAAVFLVQKIGPYHEARLRALAEALPGPLVAVEFRTDDPINRWQPVADSGAYRRAVCDAATMEAVLGRLNPAVLVCVGYSDPEIHRAMAWGQRRRIPLVTCSDSTKDAAPRGAVKEWLKRRVLSAFDSALVAGTQSDEYLESLGVPAARRFRPWDVIDNAHFENGAEAARRRAPVERGRRGLPEDYFLCVARFVPLKNLLRLLEAYAGYLRATSAPGWSLVLSGSGPQEAELRSAADRLGVAARTHFAGFLDYESLPGCYGLANALVLASYSETWGLVVNEAMAAGLPVLVSAQCGCAPDLVKEGETGYTFDPYDVAALARVLSTMASLPADRRVAMGRRSREVIAEYSPRAFASGLSRAVDAALRRRRPAAGFAHRQVLRFLSRRTAG